MTPKLLSPSLLRVALVAGVFALVLMNTARGQALPQVEDGFRNVFSYEGPPVANPGDPLIPPGGDPLRPAYDAQWRNGTAFGGWVTTRITSNPDGSGALLAGPTHTNVGTVGNPTAGQTTLKFPSFQPTANGVPIPGHGVQLLAVRLARPLVVISTSFALGAEIPPPLVNAAGQPVPADFYFAQPANAYLDPPTNSVRNATFYWSPHAGKVYATQPGVVIVAWRARASGTVFNQTYVISTAPVKAERRIFWTENGFNGPRVQVPESRVNAVNIVYNTFMPQTVPTAFVSPYVTPPADPNLQLPPELRTIWYDPLDKLIKAYNREGRVFVEYLGNVQTNGVDREQLGYEIVSVVKEVRPTTLKVDIGDAVLPPPDIDDGQGGLLADQTLQHRVIAGMSFSESAYLYEHISQGGTRRTLFAIRQTAPGVFIDGVEQQTGNEVLIYWMESGERAILWPRHYAGYLLEWPANQDRYSTFARSDQALGDAGATGIQLSSANNPALVYQDDPSNQHAVLAAGNVFYTNVNASDPDGRALIRYTNGDDIWFERVFSQLDTSFAGYNSPIPTNVGHRLEAPAGADTVAGYIRQAKGTAFNPVAYVDPFVAGFQEAENGAIIGVNALPANNQLEVWWFRKSRPPGTRISATLWPSFVRTYQLHWPAAAPEIVLASNAGSNDLPSLQAAGVTYHQNDATRPGYNPNEEHALMLNGRAWALRDDLNTPASSQPFVLVSYTEADGRPAMALFKVLRENATYQFNYSAIAGTILQSPMPLPLLPPPLKDTGSLASYEFQPSAVDPPLNFDAQRDVEFVRYRRFTWADRKGAIWIFRGPHAGNTQPPAVAPTLVMRYFYKTREGFYYPGIATQPAVGTITPYLRPYQTPGNPASGFAGDPITGLVPGEPLERSQDVVFTPNWPASVPELRVGETLTTPKYGLPAVRGQTSTELIYQQSIATDPTNVAMAARSRSARLFDPTRAKTYPLGVIPASIHTSDFLGRKYFPNLPPHLSRRLYFDPNVGADGSLVLIGEFKDEPVGEKYLLLNILSAADIAAARDICDGNDPERQTWDLALEKLSTTIETFKEDPALRGTYIVDETGLEESEPDFDGTTYSVQQVGSTEPSRTPQVIEAFEPVEIHFSDSAIDSYAVSASGGGQGYVVLAVGNGAAFTPAGEPVSLHVFKVTPPLARGELKVIASANPLDEKLTLQHSGDFAGHPEEYDFEWRYAPPVDGVPPVLYTFQRSLLLGDSNGTPATEWRLFQNPAAGYVAGRAVGADVSAGTPLSLPHQQIVVNNGQGTASHGVSLPNAFLRRQFTATQRPLRLFVSLDLSVHDGAIVFLNGAEVAVWNVPGRANSFTSGTPGSDFNPLPRNFEVPANALVLGENTLTLDLYTRADAGIPATVNARLEGTIETENLAPWLDLALSPGETPGNTPGSANGKVRHVIGGSSLLTLTDNYFIVRYRARDPNNAAYEAPGAGGGWSKWVNPQLAEGWIKRVLAGINPFQQRVTDLFNNAISTDVSLLTQAGRRWEGDIALNLENINDFGLIEIYETVLNRGKGLSIEGSPPINYSGANDALLLASGYLSDLYMILGNEAFADAANPTIAYSSVLGGSAGNIATSLFAFKGQQSTVLDEELSLLRGRDDFLQPGSRVTPVYNRLFWNYTRGIDSGEAIYAVNYNIRDLDLDGVVNAEDATILYPQGHGDAYGHYLTALTGYYSLLGNPNFAWTPRTEAVLVLGQAVQVDFTDERKFATAAAALARTASQIGDLTYRQQYRAGNTSGWSGLRDGRTNAQSGRVRRWGADEWISRGGQGAYLHWLTANSLLPAVDPNPAHEGIQKIDRTTVPELSEIVAQAEAIQQTLDNVDANLNPLGLSDGAIVFDIDPTFLDVGSTAQTGRAAVQGLTHFDQVFERAIAALKNASAAFNNAQNSTQFLREQEDSLDEQRAAINEQERVFTNGLIEIYGTPYSDDIGPGRTYAQGYAGPDLVHPMYTEITEDFTQGFFTPLDESVYTLYLNLQPNLLHAADFTGFDPNNATSIPAGISNPVSYTLDAISGNFRKPPTWTGQRGSPGEIQTAVSDLLLARQDLFGALYDFDRMTTIIRQQIALYKSAVETHNTVAARLNKNQIDQSIAESVETALESASQIIETSQGISDRAEDIFLWGLPGVIGLTSVDPSFPARAAAAAASTATWGVLDGVQVALGIGQRVSAQARSGLERAMEIDIENAQWAHENRQLLHDLRDSLQDFIEFSGAIDANLRRYDQAQRDLQAVGAKGLRFQQERLVFRQRAAAIVQGFRTRDFAFRAFRNEALEKYKTLFELAARYTYLAANAYDYETGLLDASGEATAAEFYQKIVQARALGVIVEGQPQFGGSSTGDPGLSGVLAEMAGDWSVVKTRFGFNNPDPARTTFSLRNEKFRILNGPNGELAWKDVLRAHTMPDILEDPDVKRYCMQVTPSDGGPMPGIVIPFETTITPGQNFFGLPLAGGDHTYTSSAFATKVRSSGIAIAGYVGMEVPTTTDGALDEMGATSPPDPYTGFNDPNALSATPYVYLIPAGVDTMRSPPLGDFALVRSWSVEDQAIPMPFNIGGSDFATNRDFISGSSLSEPAFILRKHQAFRAVPESTDFPSDRIFTNSRLVGRSVWNSRWKLVIPGGTLLADPQQGLRTFTDTVTDVMLHFETYSYSGN